MTVLMAVFASIMALGLTDPKVSSNLPRATIAVGGHRIVVELAETPQDQAQGLMFRKELKRGHGMLFVFSDISVREFWMKNTYIPLSIAFFGSELRISKIGDMDPQPAGALKIPRISSDRPARLALEVPQGWFAKNNIKVGDKLSVINAPRGGLLSAIVTEARPKSGEKGP